MSRRFLGGAPSNLYLMNFPQKLAKLFSLISLVFNDAILPVRLSFEENFLLSFTIERSELKMYLVIGIHILLLSSVVVLLLKSRET